MLLYTPNLPAVVIQHLGIWEQRILLRHCSTALQTVLAGLLALSSSIKALKPVMCQCSSQGCYPCLMKALQLLFFISWSQSQLYFRETVQRETTKEQEVPLLVRLTVNFAMTGTTVQRPAQRHLPAAL